MENRKLGKILWYDHKKGFGLIKCEEGNVFIHHSNINVKISDKKYLYEDEIVEFRIEYDEKNGKMIAKELCGKNNEKLRMEIEGKEDQSIKKKKNKKVRNTVNFNPTKKPPTMRVISTYSEINKIKFTTRDAILMPPNLFCEENDLSIYNKLLNEIRSINEGDNIWKLWHVDTHYIADDHLKWKEKCPTFKSIIEKIKSHFNMKVNATRFNYYKNDNEWKPYHFDAAALDERKLRSQNFTVGWVEQHEI